MFTIWVAFSVVTASHFHLLDNMAWGWVPIMSLILVRITLQLPIITQCDKLNHNRYPLFLVPRAPLDRHTRACAFTTTTLPPPTRQAGAMVIFLYVVGAIRAKLPVLENEVTQEILDMYLAKWDTSKTVETQGVKM